MYKRWSFAFSSRACKPFLCVSVRRKIIPKVYTPPLLFRLRCTHLWESTGGNHDSLTPNDVPAVLNYDERGEMHKQREMEHIYLFVSAALKNIYKQMYGFLLFAETADSTIFLITFEYFVFYVFCSSLIF